MISLNRTAEKPLRLARMTLVAAAALAVWPGLANAHDYKARSLTIVHPWSRATAPGAKVAGGYFTVKNDGDQPDRLVAVTAEISDKPEIHEMSMKGDIMQMRALDNGLPVPAHGEATLKPGSYHVMFMGLKRQLKEGDTFKGTLTFEKAGAVPVEFKVGPMGSMPASHGDH